MTRLTKDLAVAAAFALLAVVFLVEGRGLPFAARGIPGPGLFPVLLAVTILCFAAALVALTLVQRRRDARTPKTLERSAAKPSAAAAKPGAAELTPEALADDSGLAAEVEDDEPRSLLRPFALWLLILVISVGLPILGFLPAMLLLTGVLLLGMERRHDVASLVSAVAVPVAFYYLFGTLLDVRLPTGFFG